MSLTPVPNFPMPHSPAGFNEPTDPSMPAQDPWSDLFGAKGPRPLVQSMAYDSPKGGGTSATPASYIVGKTSQDRIDALKESKDPAQKRLGRTIENAQIAYGDLIAKGAQIEVTTSPGNGGQPVMLIMGPGFDRSKEARVHTHYHGDNATVADPLGSKAGTNARIRDVIAQDPQTVFVLPESGRAGTQVDSPEHDNSYSVHWEETVVSQSRTTQDVLTAAGITQVGKQVVSFHSGGGKVVQRLMELDASGAGLKADRLELHDCFYGTKGHDWRKGPDWAGWEQSFVKWAGTANGKAVTDVVYYRGSNESPRQNVVAKAFEGKYSKVEMSQQGPVEEANPIARDSNRDYVGKLEVKWAKGGRHLEFTPARNFNPDPHYRTTGQFLGAKPGP